MNWNTLKALFILGFGIFHFVLPFILQPNFTAINTLFSTLHIAYLVIPGCLILGISSIIFYLTKNRYSAIVLIFLYCGGIVLHSLYLSGVFPSVIVVPDGFILAIGIMVDALTISLIYDYYRRFRMLPS